MKKVFFFVICLLLINASSAYSENYSVYIRRIDSNIYEDTSQKIIIKTRMCLELSIGDSAVLIGYGSYYGKLVFLDYDNRPKEECDVEAVYKRIKF